MARSFSLITPMLLEKKLIPEPVSNRLVSPSHIDKQQLLLRLLYICCKVKNKELISWSTPNTRVMIFIEPRALPLNYTQRFKNL